MRVLVYAYKYRSVLAHYGPNCGYNYTSTHIIFHEHIEFHLKHS